MKRTLLVTGGAGFIGSHVVRLFVNKYPDYRILNLDNLTYAGNLANLKDVEGRPNYRFVKMDICDFDGICKLMQDEKVDGVIHLAAESHVDRSIKDPFTFARTNVMGTLTLLEASRRCWQPFSYRLPASSVAGESSSRSFCGEAGAEGRSVREEVSAAGVSPSRSFCGEAGAEGRSVREEVSAAGASPSRSFCGEAGAEGRSGCEGDTPAADSPTMACRFYHISTDEVYGALEITDPDGVEPPFSTKASSGKHHLAYGRKFFTEDLKYQPHSPYSAAKASSDHFVRAYHDTYGMPTIVTNCSNNYGPYQFPEKLIPLFINNIRHGKPLPVYGRGENVRDWLYVEDHARAIDLIFHRGKVAETYNIGGFNEWKNIDLVKVLIKTVDRLLGNPEGTSDHLITYVTDRAGHDLRYAINSTKLQKELGWEPSLQFEEGLEKTVRWYLDNQAWMDNVTSGDYQRYYEAMYKNR